MRAIDKYFNYPAHLAHIRAQSYYYLKKSLRKEMPKKDYLEQELILDEQWWEDVKPLFGYPGTIFLNDWNGK